MANGDEQEELGTYEAAKKEFGEKWQGLELQAMVKELIAAEESKAELKRRHTRAQAACDLLRYNLIPDAMEKAELDTVTYTGIGRVTLTPDVLVSVKAGMKDKLFAWLKKNKLGDLIQGTVNSSTLRAFVKERIKKGKKYPSEQLNVTAVTRASITKA